MAGSITDLLDRVTDSNTVRPIIASLASPGKAIGAASLNLDAATSWTTETAIHFSIYETMTVGSVTVKDTTTQTDWKGTLSGVAISNLTLTGGTDRSYTAGAVVELTPTARYAKDLYDWATVGHNQNGTHKAFTESSIVPTAALQDNAVTIAKIANEAWSSWAPAYVNFTLGNGTLSYAKYLKVGRTVHFRIRVILGTTSAVSGNIRFSLPINTADYVNSDTALNGTVALVDTGSSYIVGIPRPYSTSTIEIVAMSSGGANVGTTNLSSTAPFTWGSGDVWSAAGSYESA